MTPKQWLLVKFLALLMLLRKRNRPKIREKVLTSSLTGKKYMKELMQGSSTVIYDEFRMEKSAFLQLCGYFSRRKWLRNSKHVNVDEKMAMFLSIISHNKRNRIIRHRFQHSGETVSKYFHEVLDAMMKFAHKMIRPPNFENLDTEGCHIELREGPFKGAVGALDGTLIDAHIPVDEQVPYRGRGQGKCFQNVMAVCDFDMKFFYVMAGWEGIAHDSRVLNETLRNPANNFPMPPPSMYYLCDAAYTHTTGFLTPYRGTRYWLKTYRNNRATSPQERFNHSHALLRNVIERSFGVLKKRFPILSKMPSYDFDTQRDIVIACMAVHNFLRRVSRHDELFREFEEDDVEGEEVNIPEQPGHATIFSAASQAFMTTLRDNIANQL